jgi:hypothetical protein
MHFLRPRRQRIEYRINRMFAGSSFSGEQFDGSQEAMLNCRVFARSDEHSKSYARQARRSSKILGDPISRFHYICGQDIADLNEQELLALFFKSEEHPIMREKIALHCVGDNNLKHITADYLDRIAKLKLFL